MAYDQISKLLAQINGERLPASEVEVIEPDAENESVFNPVALPNAAAPVPMQFKDPNAQMLSSAYQQTADQYGKQKQVVDSKYQELVTDRSKIEPAKINDWDQIMGALVPLAVAALGGEAGKLSQPKAFDSYQGYLEKDRVRKQSVADKKIKDADLKLKSVDTMRQDYGKKQAQALADSQTKPVQLQAAGERAAIAQSLAYQKDMRPNESEKKAAEYAVRLENAYNEYNRMGGDGTLFASMRAPSFDVQSGILLKNGIPAADFLKDYITDDAVRSQVAIEQQIINSLLRRDTGAAISPTEYSNYTASFFPRKGDSADTIRIKLNGLRIALEQLKLSAGRQDMVPVAQPPPLNQVPGGGKGTAPTITIQQMREKLKKDEEAKKAKKQKAI